MSTLELFGPLARFNKSAAPRRRPGKRAIAYKSRLGLPLLAAPLLLMGAEWGADPPTAPPEVSIPEVHPLGGTLPAHVDESVDRWIERFTTDERTAFQRLLQRRGLYVDLIREKLRDRGMPEELMYLAVIESGLSPFAVSSASAVGMWQLMSPTAVQFGLRVDEWVDERRDPERATDAALDYLAWLKERYGSWYLVAAAYNAGPGRVDREIARHAGGLTEDEAVYWDVYDHLPRETREYLPRLVATTVLAEDAAAYGFQPWDGTSFRFDRVFVPASTPLSAVARALGVEPALLWRLNPQLIRGVTPPGQTYGVRVPVGASADVVAALGPARGRRRAD